MDINYKLKILYFNACSIVNKIHELFYHLETNHIHIACINETFLKDSIKLPTHPDYHIHRADRDDGAKGGVAIIIRKNIKHKLLGSINTEIMENIGAEVLLDNGSKIAIYSVYLPGGCPYNSISNSFARDLRKLTNLRASFFICGDLNAKHRHWNCTRANQAGNILYAEYSNRNFIISHPDDPTYIPHDQKRASSTIDLVLTNRLHEMTSPICTGMYSDHAAISFEIETRAQAAQCTERFQFDYSSAEWKKYQQIIHRHIATAEQIDVESCTTHDVDEKIENFTNLLIHARNKAVPKKLLTQYKLNLSDEIISKIRIKNAHMRIWQRTRNPNVKAIVNQLTSEIRAEIAEIRNQNWSKKLADIKPTNQSVWKAARLLKNGAMSMPNLKSNGETATTSNEKAKLIGDTFEKNHNNPFANHHMIHTQIIKNQVNKFDMTSQHAQIDVPDDAEIAEIIKNLKNSKAPGDDDIKNCLIKRLPPSGIKSIRQIVSACLKLGYFPPRWKHANVIPIHKPQKDPSNPLSYRPISLLSSLSKILERAILNRLSQFIDDKDILPNIQHGFRKNYSTLHQLHRVITHAKDKLETGASTGLVTLDIEKAFDRVWHDGLLAKMIKMKAPIFLIKMIQSFLSERSFSVCVNGCKSTKRNFSFGLPQGAVLSPTLYNIYASDFPSFDNCECALFADDTALFNSSHLVKPIIKSITNAATETEKYLNRWKTKINSDKTSAIFITNRRTQQIPHQDLAIFGSTIKWEENLKYLGVVLNTKLNYKSHIDYVIDRANTSIRVLYPLLNRKSQLHVTNKLLIYKLAIRPILTYGMPALKGISKTQTKRLQIIQNKTLKLILNKPWDESTQHIHQLTNMQYISDYIDKLKANFETKLYN